MRRMIPRSQEPERGFVLAVLAQGVDADDELAEIEELARTAGVEVVGRAVQHRARPAQRSYVGKGKLEELKEGFEAAEAESLLVDDELDPVQQRFLEDKLGARVIDRTQLILDIFAQHAVSAEGKRCCTGSSSPSTSRLSASAAAKSWRSCSSLPLPT